MKIKIKPIDINDIPAPGNKKVTRADWAQSVVDAFIESNDRAWEVLEGMQGNFSSYGDASSYYTSLGAYARTKLNHNIKVKRRGTRIFLVKED